MHPHVHVHTHVYVYSRVSVSQLPRFLEIIEPSVLNLIKIMEKDRNSVGSIRLNDSLPMHVHECVLVITE